MNSQINFFKFEMTTEHFDPWLELLEFRGTMNTTCFRPFWSRFKSPCSDNLAVTIVYFQRTNSPMNAKPLYPL